MKDELASHRRAILAAAYSQTIRVASRHAMVRLRSRSVAFWFDVLIETTLGALLVFSPFAFGVVDAWSELVVLAVAATLNFLMLGWVTFGAGRNGRGLIWSWAYVPIGAFLVLVALQLLPLPARIIGLVSPGTVATRNRLLGDMPQLLKSFTLTFYASATRHDLRLLLACATVFVTVLNFYRRPDQIKRLLTVVVLLGGAVGLLALAQDLTGAEQIYWSVPTPQSVTAGPFVHYSHYSQFMNLCIGAALALLLVKGHQCEGNYALMLELVRPKRRHNDGSHRFRRSRNSLGDGDCPYLAPWSTWWLLATVLLGVGTVFLSFSRGGVISLLAAAAFTAVSLGVSHRLGFSGWVFGALVLSLFLAIFYIGFDSIYNRLATLGRISEAAGGRWDIVTNLVPAWRQFPVFGTGMGTHEVVYPMFDHANGSSIATHAENEYAQVMEETGIAGLLCLVGFAGIVWRNYRLALKAIRRTPMCAAAFGLGFGLLAVMVHSLSDFGQHLPANAVLTSVFCAVLLNLGKLSGPKTPKQVDLGTTPADPVDISSHPDRSKAMQCPRLAPAICYTLSAWNGLKFVVFLATAMILGCTWFWALTNGNRARLAERYWRTAALAAASFRQQGWQGSDERYANLISNAAIASDLQPDNVKYRYWLNIYRWQSISRDTDPGTGQALIAIDDLSYVQRIIGELHLSRALCPTYGPTLSAAGQLERFVLDNPAGAAHIRTGYALAPCDPASCFAAARLDAKEGQWESAYAELASTVALDWQMLYPAAVLCVQSGRPDEAINLTKGNDGALINIAAMIEQSGCADAGAFAARARREALSTLETRCKRTDADATSLATLAETRFRQGDYAAAVAFYRRAVDLRYDQSDWRYRLAQALDKLGQRDIALHEAHICLRLRPDWSEVKQFIEIVSVESGPAHLGT